MIININHDLRKFNKRKYNDEISSVCSDDSNETRHKKIRLEKQKQKQQTVPHWRQPMSLISLVITLIVVGVLLWLINTYIPMDGKIKKIVNVVVVIAVVLWLLSAFGILGNAHDIRVPRV